MPEASAEVLLEVKDLRVSFRSRRGAVAAVDGLSFTVRAGEVLGIVGRVRARARACRCSASSSSSATRTASSRARRCFQGRDLVAMRDKDLRSLRGKDIAMVFQDPMTSLTPVYTVGWHIAEQIRAHEPVSKAEARRRAVAAARARSASPTRRDASTTTRTSSPAACGSGR